MTLVWFLLRFLFFNKLEKLVQNLCKACLKPPGWCYIDAKKPENLSQER